MTSKMPREAKRCKGNIKKVPQDTAVADTSSDTAGSPEKREASKGTGKAVLYVKHIPHGFYEEEMKKYFSQFGEVTNLRLSRSGKTGRSRGYAFVEFADEDVARIVAETMDGYLFFNKILKCSVIPREKVHPGIFEHFHYPFPLRKEIVRAVYNRKRSFDEDQRSAKRRLAKVERTKSKLRSLGVEYDFKPEVPGYLLMSEQDPMEDSLPEMSADGSMYKMIVDTSDDSIAFKTPPRARRVIRSKKTNTSTPTLVDVTSDVMLHRKSPRMSPVKKRKSSSQL